MKSFGKTCSAIDIYSFSEGLIRILKNQNFWCPKLLTKIESFTKVINFELS